MPLDAFPLPPATLRESRTLTALDLNLAKNRLGPAAGDALHALRSTGTLQAVDVSLF